MAKELSLRDHRGVSDRDGSAFTTHKRLSTEWQSHRQNIAKSHLVTAAPLDERPWFTAATLLRVARWTSLISD